MKFSKKEEKNDIFYSSENRLTVRDEWRIVALGTDTNARASRRKQNVTRYVIDRVNGGLRANGEWCVSDCTQAAVCVHRTSFSACEWKVLLKVLWKVLLTAKSDGLCANWVMCTLNMMRMKS